MEGTWSLSQGTLGTRHLEMLVSLQHVSLDWRKKTENQEEPPEAQEEHVNGITPKPPIQINKGTA